MSLGLFGLGDPSIAQIETQQGGGKKTPPKRTTTARGDRKAVPEPR